MSEGKGADEATEVVACDPKLDLTHTIAPYLDVHFLLPMLLWQQDKGMYAKADIQNAMLKLLAETSMVEYAHAVYCELHSCDPASTPMQPDMDAKKGEAMRHWEDLHGVTENIRNVLDGVVDKERPGDAEGGDGAEGAAGASGEDGAEPETEPLVDVLLRDNNFTLEYLGEEYGISEEEVGYLFNLARLTFDTGDYTATVKYMKYFRMLVSEDDPRSLQALWGKLAAELLDLDDEPTFIPALEDLKALRDMLDRLDASPLELLQQRAWMLHWALFVFFQYGQVNDDQLEKSRQELVKFFFATEHLKVIQTLCPWLLRYLTITAITAQMRGETRALVLKDLVRVISQEAYTHQDPVTEFFEALLIKFDFDGAQAKLRECEVLIRSDFFLSSFARGAVEQYIKDFMGNARLLVFETYCRIHRKIDIGMLAAKLNMSTEAAERWVVELIRNAHLNAMISSKDNQVIMGVRHRSIHQRVIEKTKDLSFRSQLLANGLEKHFKTSARSSEKEGGSGSGGGDKGGDRKGGDGERRRERREGGSGGGGSGGGGGGGGGRKRESDGDREKRGNKGGFQSSGKPRGAWEDLR